MTDAAGTHARIASSYRTITPSDTLIFELETAGIYVGVTGNITVKRRDGTTQLFSNVAASFILPVNCVGVMATGTTATGLVGMA